MDSSSEASSLHIKTAIDILQTNHLTQSSSALLPSPGSALKSVHNLPKCKQASCICVTFCKETQLNALHSALKTLDGK